MIERKKRLIGKLFSASAAMAACLTLGATAQADYDFNGTGDGTSWEDVGNWLNSGVAATAIPAGGDHVTITGGAVDIDMDADTWTYLVNNALLTGGATGEYRTQKLRLAQFGTSTLTVDIGDGNIWRNTNSSLSYVGSQSGSNGTWNIISGDIRNESSILDIAEKAGSTGLLNISGGTNTRFIATRESGGISVKVGTGGDGTVQIDGGKFRSRAGVEVGSNGLFRVLGSNVTEVEVGSEGSLDGKWVQAAGGALEVGIDAGGVTQINVADKGGAGTSATFDAGSILDVSFLAAAMPGTWAVMEVQNGVITDSGISLVAGAGWSYNVDNSGANGLLTVSYVPEPAALALVGIGGAVLITRKR